MSIKNKTIALIDFLLFIYINKKLNYEKINN